MSRTSKIETIVARLAMMKGSDRWSNDLYALDVNVAFFEAIRNPISYAYWLLTAAPRLDRDRLLELTDFYEEEWDVAMHAQLIEMQRNPKIGLIEPLVAHIVSYALNHQGDLVLANFGAGGMEVDRQVITRLIDAGYSHRLKLFSIDRSAVTRSMARSNLKNLPDSVEIRDVGRITRSMPLDEANAQYTVYMAADDIFRLIELTNGSFDLLYHSLFRHHLSASEKKDLENVAHRVSKKYIEFDGWFNIPVMLPQTIVGWKYPEFLNAEIFSNLRFDRKGQVQQRAAGHGTVSFYRKSGFYLFEHSSVI